MRILVIDNYDSFVYNLVQYIGECEAKILVHRNDEITLDEAKKIRPERIVISPGPGTPEKARYFGACTDILQILSKKIPTLGVCLGHQGIIFAFGGRIIPAGRLVHGKTSFIRHDGKGIYRDIENPFEATRYHSLVGDKENLPNCLQITAKSIDDEEIMGVRHKDYPIEGVQFHPESILTTSGRRIIRNFLED